MKMANTLKGNLGLKSSPLAPTSSKLTTQYIVLDHMTNHYKKLSKAKCAIDNKPPKSLQTSQKMRDRKNRNRMMSTTPQGNFTTQDEDLHQQYEDILNEEPEDDEDRLVHSIMRSALTDKPKGSNHATYGSYSENTYTTDLNKQRTMGGMDTLYNGDTIYEARPNSARSIRSARSTASMTARAPMTHDLNRITYKGDVLQTRSHRFTEGAPFTPRTNKSNAQSRLKASNNYNPPRPRSSAGKKQNSYYEDDFEKEDRPKSAPRPRKPRGTAPSQSDQNFQDGLETAQLSETMLMDMSLRSRDDQSGREDADHHQVPRLAISMDKDKINWLQEQATKAEVRYRSGANLPVAEDPIPEESASALNQSAGLSRSLKMETMKKEEEQKYLAFAQEVTDDVLAKGISSDKVMHRIFENHIERRKKDLDETRMRQVIKDLRINLGLKEAMSEHGSVGRASSTNNNNIGGSRPASSGGRSTEGGSGKGAGSVHGSVHGTGSVRGAGSVHGSEKSAVKEDDLLGATLTNGQTSTSGEPFQTTSQSERDLSTTLESTSTMRFAGTQEMFSTINSEASQEAREAMLDNTADLTSTQALRQYQMTLTAQEEGREGEESAMESTLANGVDTDVSEKSHKLDRPATGERRDEDEDLRSDTSSFKASQSGESTTQAGDRQQPRTRRRERMRKSKATEEFSSSNSQPASTETLGGGEHNGQGNISDDVLSSSQRTGLSTNGGVGGGDTTDQPAPPTTHNDLSPPEPADDAESVISSSSTRPVAKPRNRTRTSVEPMVAPAASKPLSEDDRASDVPSGQNSEREVSESKQDSHPTDSGVASASHRVPSHDDTLEEPSEADKPNKDEVDDEYDDDYEADDDDGQEVSTHRTSDDDF